MARILGVNIPPEKKIKVSLRYIHGIGETLAAEILEKANVDPEKRTNELSRSELEHIRAVMEGNYEIEGELRQKVFRNIKRLKEIKSYRGVMHRRGLPVRGQRTRTNAHTRKGRGIAVGGLKRKLEKT